MMDRKESTRWRNEREIRADNRLSEERDVNR